MQQLKTVGRNASAAKYDLLTALGTWGSHGDKHLQRLVLRFVTLIVARYNWQTDEISIGQREIARLWNVDERTVKRDLARLRTLGWLVLKRPAVRGRVAVHGLDLPAILAATESVWAAVGPDYEERMRGGAAPAAVLPSNVVAFPPAPQMPQPAAGGIWAQALDRLGRDHPALCAAWFRPLAEAGQGPGRLELLAPSRFHASFVVTHHLQLMLEAVRRVDGSIRNLGVSAE